MASDFVTSSIGSITSDLLSQIESLEVPPNIDPQLLALWRERERKSAENQQPSPKPNPQFGRKLNRLFAAYIGITVMCLVIVLGLVQHQESANILQNACIAFLIYAVIGFFVGCIAEYCINDSVETLLREIVRRSNEHSAEQPDASADLSETENR
jgi:hypothetical protein